MEVDKIYWDWEKDLWSRYDTTFDNAKYTIYDGIISPMDYYNSKLKVMFLNREPYDTDNVSFNLNEALEEQINNEKPIFSGQKWLPVNLKDQLATLHLISENNFENFSEETVTEYVKDWDQNKFQTNFKATAYTNIKKSDGKIPSDLSDLRDYFEKGKDYILEQIKFFNPSIIMGGNIIDGILDNSSIEWGKTLYTKAGILNVFQIIIDGKTYPIMDLNHPSAHTYRGGSMGNYYLEVFKALQAIEFENKGLLTSRLNQSCFLQ